MLRRAVAALSAAACAVFGMKPAEAQPHVEHRTAQMGKLPDPRMHRIVSRQSGGRFTGFGKGKATRRRKRVGRCPKQSRVRRARVRAQRVRA